MQNAPVVSLSSWLMVALLGFVWGSTFLVTELALAGLTPLWLAAGRIGFGALASLALWSALGLRLFAAPARAGQFAVLGGLGLLTSALPFMLIAWGQQFVTAGFAGVSMASVALVVLPLAHFLVPGERMTWRKTTGFAVGFVGVLVLIGAQAFESSGADHELPGRFACILAALCYGFSGIVMRRLPAIDPIGLATVLLMAGACFAIPAALLIEGLPPAVSGEVFGIVAFLGLVPTAAANLLRVQVIRTAGPVFMSLTNYQVPLWSVLMGVAILGEPLPPTLLLAMLLILGGVAISQYGALRRLFAR
ncbi:MAG: DMT family transporter [Rhodobacteraceae bacterium]|nr:DMT family transporter [Paracoccaceae bacterium]